MPSNTWALSLKFDNRKEGHVDMYDRVEVEAEIIESRYSIEKTFSKTTGQKRHRNDTDQNDWFADCFSTRSPSKQR